MAVNMYSNEPNHLVMMLNKNCQAAEQLALETVIANDVPYFNTFRELTKGDCCQILKKYEDVFNTLEQAVILSGLTDYITCASQSELFDTFRKKNNRDGLPTLLMHLNSKWVKFFRKLGRYDLTYAQLKSLMFLLRQSLKRLPEAYQRLLTSDALVMGESFLEKAQMPLQQYSLLTVTNMSAQSVTPQRNLGRENLSQKKIAAKKCDNEIKDHSAKSKIENVKNQRTITSLLKTKGSIQNTCTDSKLDLHSNSKTEILTTPSSESGMQKNIISTAEENSTSTLEVRNTIKSHQPVTVLDLTRPGEEKPTQTQKKYTYDITKYILKPHQNKNSDKESTQITASLSDPTMTRGKENVKIWPAFLQAGGGVDSKLKEPVAHITPSGKSSMAIDMNSPTKKKHQVEEETVTSRRVNAFELMMKQSRAKKDQHGKRKSLFQ